MAIHFARLAGTLTIGATPLDVSAQVIGCTLASEVETGDVLTVLTGEQISSGMTTTSTLSGTMVLDPYTGGIGEYSWVNHGTEQPFTFTPNDAAMMSFAGVVTVTRLSVGSDAFGNVLQSEFAWSVVGDVTPTWGTAPAV